MASYDLTQDETTGTVVLRIKGPLADDDAPQLTTDMLDMIALVRLARGTVRVLIDNSYGFEFASVAMKALATRLRAAYQAGDRIAVLVPNSIGKLRAKQNVDVATQCFLSETAAMTWLAAWDGGIAPAGRLTRTVTAGMRKKT
jgi:hypothetical protein